MLKKVLIIILSIYIVNFILLYTIHHTPPKSIDKFLRIAHRGGMGLFPENTIYAFKKAIQLGIDVIETDVWMTKDGYIILIHDKTLERTTNGKGDVTKLPLGYIKSLDAGYNFTKSGKDFPYRGLGIKIPTLQEALDIIKNNNVMISIELKDNRRKAIEKTIEIISSYGLQDKVILAAFSHKTMKIIRKLTKGNYTTGFSHQEVKRAIILYHLGLFGFFFSEGRIFQIPEWQDFKNKKGIYLISKDFIKKAHLKGLKIHVWTINDKDTMEKLIKRGVDGIITDYPDKLNEVIAKLRNRSL